MKRADVAQPEDRADRLPGASATTRRRRRSPSSRAWTRSIPKSARRSRSSAFRSTSRSCSPASRWTRCSTACRWRRRSATKLAELGIIFCSFSEAVKHHPELVRKYLGLGRAVHRQLLRDAQLGGLQRRLVRLRAEGRALPDGAVDLLPHQREEHRPVRADADRRRRGLVRELPRRAARRRCATSTSCTRRSSSSSRSTTRRSSTRRFRTGTRATRTARAASTTS